MQGVPCQNDLDGDTPGFLRGPRGFGLERVRLQLADIAGSEPAAGQLRDAATDLRGVGSQLDARLSRHQADDSEPAVRDEIEPCGHESFGHRIGHHTSCRNPLRALPDRFDGKLRRGFELLRSPGQKQREHRISQKTGLDELRPGDSQIGDALLKSWIVPQRNGNRFVLSQAIVKGNP